MRKWVLIALGLLVVWGIVSSENERNERAALLAENGPLSDDGSSKAWEYEKVPDAMRGTVTEMASLTARGGFAKRQPRLIVQKTGGQYEAAIRSSLEKGGERPSCLSGRVWHVNVKFDNGPVSTVECDMGMDAGLPRSLVKRIKESRLMMIEMSDSMGGTVQYSYAVAGLKL